MSAFVPGLHRTSTFFITAAFLAVKSAAARPVDPNVSHLHPETEEEHEEGCTSLIREAAGEQILQMRRREGFSGVSACRNK